MEHDTIDNSFEARSYLARLDEYIQELDKENTLLRLENKELRFRILELELEKKIPKFIEIAQ